MATDNLIYGSSTSQIKHFMLRSSTTGQGVTGKVAADFTGKYNINGGAEVTLSFSAGTAGDSYSSGKICELGLGKYAWHVPNTLFGTSGSVSVVLTCADAIDVHFDWVVTSVNRDVAAFGANTTAPATPTNVSDSQAAIEAAIETLRATNHTVVSRSANDANPITFAWPVSGATITGTKSINNGSYSAVDGAISFLRTEDGKHYYTLAYDADDRITTEGQVRYKFVDGTYTRYVVLRVELSALSATTMNSVADSVLKRNVSNVEATADEHTLATAILSLLEWSISGGDLIIKRTDGTTTHYTKTLSSATGTGDVITGLN